MMTAMGANIATCSRFHMKGLQGEYMMIVIGKKLSHEGVTGSTAWGLQWKAQISDLGFRVLTIEFGMSSFTSEPPTPPGWDRWRMFFCQV